MKYPCKDEKCIICKEAKSEYSLSIVNTNICSICEKKLIVTDPWKDDYSIFIKACKKIWQGTKNCLSTN